MLPLNNLITKSQPLKLEKEVHKIIKTSDRQMKSVHVIMPMRELRIVTKLHNRRINKEMPPYIEEHTNLWSI